MSLLDYGDLFPPPISRPRRGWRRAARHGALAAVLLASVAAMGQHGCDTPAAPTPCAQPPPCDTAAAYREGYADAARACPDAPPCPAPEPCPDCDEDGAYRRGVEDGRASVDVDRLRRDAVEDVRDGLHAECSFGSSLHAAPDVDGEVKRRIGILLDAVAAGRRARCR